MASRESHAALHQLRSAGQAELMDAIDRLRSLEFEKQLHLPQLIVCGNQTSGKSSVLEAISHVSFPTGTSTTTKFASELILRNNATESIRVSIHPGRNTPVSVRNTLADFNPTFEGSQDFASILHQATELLQTVRTTPSHEFSSHHLRVEISGPQQPHLTLVDLPGMIAINHLGRTQVNQLITGYMQQSRSIILAVVSGAGDPETQPVLEMAKAVDPHGRRTMGILTMPDRVQPNPEQPFIDHVLNRRWHLDLGWHVLRNCNSAEITAQPRDQLEESFFSDSNSPWNVVPPKLRGIHALRSRLRDVLFQKITESLPHLSQELDQEIAECDQRIQHFGPPRPSHNEQLLYLQQVCSDMEKLIREATEGNYQSPFFEKITDSHRDAALLRNKMRTLSRDFNEEIGRWGCKYLVTDRPSQLDKSRRQILLDTSNFDETGLVYASDRTILSVVTRYMENHQGCELQGEYSDKTVGIIFKKQCSPWNNIARKYVGKCIETVQLFFRMALKHAVHDPTADTIYAEVANRKFELCRQDVEAKVSELLTPFTTMWPQTLNARFEEIRNTEDGAQDAFRPDGLAPATRVLIRAMAYYDIAERTFVDNVVTLAVENCVIEPLKTIFNMKTLIEISALDKEKFARLASEPDDVMRGRETTERNLQTLKEVREVCNKHAFYQVEPFRVQLGHEIDQNVHDNIETYRIAQDVQDLPELRLDNGKHEVPLHGRPADAARITPPATPEPRVRRVISPSTRHSSGSTSRDSRSSAGPVRGNSWLRAREADVDDSEDEEL